MKNIKRIIGELGVVVIVGKLDNPGYYDPVHNAIFVNEGLDELQHEVVLIHELGHAALQRGEWEVYDATINMKSKMEYEANYFMVELLFDDYMKVTDIEPEDINVFDFMRQNDIPSKDEYMVREVIANYKFDGYKL